MRADAYIHIAVQNDPAGGHRLEACRMEAASCDGSNHGNLPALFDSHTFGLDDRPCGDPAAFHSLAAVRCFAFAVDFLPDSSSCCNDSYWSLACIVFWRVPAASVGPSPNGFLSAGLRRLVPLLP